MSDGHEPIAHDLLSDSFLLQPEHYSISMPTVEKFSSFGRKGVYIS
jgi:hypothetical protein